MERVELATAHSSHRLTTNGYVNCPDRPVSIAVEGSNQVIRCRKGETLLGASQRIGQRCLQVGCRGGGCGVCKVKVLQGTYTERFMSKKVITDADRENHVVLACCIYPAEDMVVQPLGRRPDARD